MILQIFFNIQLKTLYLSLSLPPILLLLPILYIQDINLLSVWGEVYRINRSMQLLTSLFVSLPLNRENTTTFKGEASTLN